MAKDFFKLRTRRVEAPPVPATAEHPYFNHPTLTSHTMVRSNGTVDATTSGFSPDNVSPYAALSTRPCLARPAAPPTSRSGTTPNLLGTLQVNAPSPVTATQWRTLSAPDN